MWGHQITGQIVKNIIQYHYINNWPSVDGLIIKMINKEKKSKLIKEYSVHEKDTGSSDVQIALLSQEIDNLVSHLKDHPKDIHSKRGLIRMVIKRKKLLSYLKKENEKRYTTIIKKIGLKK